MRKLSNSRHALALLGAGLATVATGVLLAVGPAAASPASVHAAAYRLTATLTPAQEVPAVQAPAGAGGHFNAVLFRTGLGTARIAALAGCKILAPPRRSGLPTKIKCGGSVATLPGAPGQWRLVWHLSVTHLTGPATAADIHLASIGAAAPPMFALCGPCASTAHGTHVIEASQAASLASDSSYVNVDTTAHPSGEVRGQITRTTIGISLGG